MQRNIKKHSGYTLIELLAAAAIFAGMMIISVATFSVASSQESTISTRRLIHQSARTSVEQIIREVAVSRNEYDSSGTIANGNGAYMLAVRSSLNANQEGGDPCDELDCPTSSHKINGDDNILDQRDITTYGNALILFYYNASGIRNTKAYYLCPHPKDSSNSTFALGVKDLNLSASSANFARGSKWTAIKNAMTCTDINTSSPTTWRQITSNDVIIEKATDVRIYGNFPEQGLKVQPYLTISVKAKNRQGSRAEEQFYSTYKTTTVHRDYGPTQLP